MAFEGVKFMIEKCHVIDHLELAGIFSIQMCKIMDSFEKIELFYENIFIKNMKFTYNVE